METKHTTSARFAGSQLHSLAVYLLAAAHLFVCALSTELPAAFDERVLPYTQRNGQYIDQLGHIIKLDTLLSPKQLDTFTTRFEIYTRQRRNASQVDSIVFSSRRFCSPGNCAGPYEYDVSKMAQSDFDSSRRTLVLIGGYLTPERVEWMEPIKDLWLELEDVNVILVTWASANRYLYSTAVADTPLVARQITIFLYYLAELDGVRLMDAHFCKRLSFVGHSLGAHIAGFVGQDLAGKLGRITGLDPAGPSFDLMPRNHRLDLSDALLVDVIHTNSGKIRYANAAASAVVGAIDSVVSKTPLLGTVRGWFTKNFRGQPNSTWFGIDAQLGHLDFYANSGLTQPGCGGLMRTCDHGRSHQIYDHILRHELGLQNYAKEREFVAGGDQSAAELRRLWRKQNRLLAFAALDYDSFLSGRSFQRECPTLLAGRARLKAPFDNSFKLCSMPLDFLTPVDELREELWLEYGVNFDSDYNFQRARRFYFNTLADRPFVGDHNLLKLQLDPQHSSWHNSCALNAELTWASGHKSWLELNKQFTFVEQNDFFGLALPFVNPLGHEARTALYEVLAFIVDNQNDSVDEELLAKVLPTKIELTITSSFPTGLLETIVSRFKGSTRKANEKCRLHISSVQVHPVLGYTHSSAGLYTESRNPDDKSLELWPANLTWVSSADLADDQFELLRGRPSLLNADQEEARLVRRLDKLVLG